MYGVVMFDKRQRLYDRLCDIIERGSDGAVLRLAEAMGDRLEGRPVQTVAQHGKHVTIFERGPGQAGAKPQELAAAVTVEPGAGPILSPLDGVTPLEEMRWPPGSGPAR